MAHVAEETIGTTGDLTVDFNEGNKRRIRFTAATVTINNLKWLSTVLILTGILLTNLNNYPINILIHGLGAMGWSIAGLITKDKALMTNFGLQIPLFVIGYTYYLS